MEQVQTEVKIKGRDGNPMRDIRVEKLTVNIGVGEGGKKLENALKLIEKMTGRKGVITNARVRNPTFKIKKGDPIGAKVTLRKGAAVEFLKKAFQAVDNKIKGSSFDVYGNFAFGIHEYIDFPGVKYDPEIGIIGFDVCVTLCRKGLRVAKRRVARRALDKKQRVTREEAIAFVQNNFNVSVVD